ncbi:hypothetical protein [Oceanibaculum nanhaiense]|uniref:hypothetical protein n=1 Tax=Oceanibaculum nanhaiense TaxID=1909734 RepID=UPI00396DF1F1
MQDFQRLQKAITGSSAYQARLKGTMTDTEAVSVLQDIARTEAIALDRSEIERQIAAARQQAGELDDKDMDAVSGGDSGEGQDARNRRVEIIILMTGASA